MYFLFALGGGANPLIPRFPSPDGRGDFFKGFDPLPDILFHGPAFQHQEMICRSAELKVWTTEMIRKNTAKLSVWHSVFSEVNDIDMLSANLSGSRCRTIPASWHRKPHLSGV